MSSLIVEVCAVEEIAVHPNADRIERVRVKNWWCIAPKERYKVGDKVVYLPPDSVISDELANRWGIAKYCQQVADGLRIRAARFRTVPSFGCLQDLEDPSWTVGQDLTAHYGIRKYEPPPKNYGGDNERPHPAFHIYTDIENIGHFPNVFQEGEDVVVEEKIHGTNCRVGMILDEGQWQLMAGSHTTRKKPFDADQRASMYWWPIHNMEGVVRLLQDVSKETHNVVLFGEIFGRKIQDMQYGQTGLAFRAFDITVDGCYLDDKERSTLFSAYQIESCPVLYRGPFSLQKMNELVDGPTTVCDPAEIKEPFKGREGIVIRPAKERFDPLLGGRVILKYVSVDYHDRKNKDRTEDH